MNKLKWTRRGDQRGSTLNKELEAEEFGRRKAHTNCLSSAKQP